MSRRLENLEPPDSFVDPEKRNTRQELEALGVTIEPLRRGPGRSQKTMSDSGIVPTPKLEIQWIHKASTSPGTTLGKQISINKYTIGIGHEAVQDLARAVDGEKIKTLGFGVAPGDKCQLLVIAPNDPMGYDVKRNKSGALAVANKSTVSKLIAAGVALGRYKLHKQYGTLWVAVPVGDK